MMYRDRELQYESEIDSLTTESVRQQVAGKQYIRKRSYHAKRRTSAKTANHPGCGLGARRNRRWSW
jgi:hypothetical protein